MQRIPRLPGQPDALLVCVEFRTKYGRCFFIRLLDRKKNSAAIFITALLDKCALYPLHYTIITFTEVTDENSPTSSSPMK